MTEGDRTHYELTQKIASETWPGLITTMHLDADEHRLVSPLPARVLKKTRHSLPPYGVDVFAGPLAGLVFAEVELDDDATMQAFAPPSWSVAEVTDDLRFTGGRFVDRTPDAFAALLESFLV